MLVENWFQASLIKHTLAAILTVYLQAGFNWIDYLCADMGVINALSKVV